VIILDKKKIKKSIKPVLKKKIVKKIDPNNSKLNVKKNQQIKHVQLIELKPKLEKLHVRHSGLRKSQKWLIAGLILFVIIIIVVAFLIPRNVYDPIKDDDQNLVINTPISDHNISSNLDSVMTIEQFQNKSLALQRSIYKEIMLAQKDILEEHYSSLGLDSQKINKCILENDFTNQDVNVEKSKILMKIQKDTYLAPIIGVMDVPGIFVNGYYLSGSSSYSSIKQIIDYALSDTPITWDYSIKTYESDSNAKATLSIIYNEDHDLIKDNTVDFINSLKTSESLTPQVKNFFTSLFSQAGVNYYNYTSTKGKQIIQTLDIQVIPVVYLEGDVSKLEVMQDKNFAEMFNYLFIKTDAGGYILNQKIVFDMLVQSNINNVHQIVDYSVLRDLDDYSIGSTIPQVTLFIFSDYDCVLCNELEKNNLDNLITEYVNTNKIRIVKKDYVIHEMSALFPAIFARCSQEQDKYLEVNRKLFELSGELGNNGVVKLIMEKHKTEIDNLTIEYQKIVQSQKKQ